ncbi:MAG TPA: DUF3793 family protein [Bacillota bacterium]|nr:DUF3793 family protein [Bacillota bacterium]
MHRSFVQFWQELNKADDREYLHSVILFATAPTLAGLKPATLIGMPCSGRNLLKLWQTERSSVDGLSKFFGLDYLCLHQTTATAQVLFYRRSLLEKLVIDSRCRTFLGQYDYPESTSLEGYLEIIQKRFAKGIPHEIGVFLGVPLADVSGFIRHQGTNYLLNGYWKVYSSPVTAQIAFKLFDQSKRAVLEYLNLVGSVSKELLVNEHTR